MDIGGEALMAHYKSLGFAPSQTGGAVQALLHEIEVTGGTGE